MTGSRMQGVLDDLAAIYPDASVRLGVRPGETTARAFRILTSARHPRLAVPADAPAVARAALSRSSANDSSRDARLRRLVGVLAASRGAWMAFRTVASVSFVGPAAVETLLDEVTHGPVRFALHTGTQRANAKPVLAVYRPNGSEVGYCKVGVSPLSSALVEHETLALQAIAASRPASMIVPAVLHDGPWRSGSLLLMDAVRGDRGDRAGLPVDAMRSLITMAGVRQSLLRTSAWLTEIRRRVTRADAEHRCALERLVAAIDTRHGERLVPIGAWHGDWGPWNMAWSGARAVVWDWERFASDVPAGMDAAHFVAHSRLRQIGDLPLASRALVGDAEPAVARLLASLSPAHGATELARTVVDCYLLEIASRFAVDAHRSGIGPVGRLAAWYEQVAAARLGVSLAPLKVVTVPVVEPLPGPSSPPPRRLRSDAPDAIKARARAAVAVAGRATSGVRMLPGFLISGVQRGGTTSLFRTLARHPDVVAPLMHKGVHFFDTAEHYSRGLAWYQGHFPIAALADRRAQNGRAVTGEASPYYVFHPLAGERIGRDLPGARIIVLLRDPVERAYSAYKQETGRGFETETFANALELEDRRLDGEVERMRLDPTYQSFHHQHHAYRRRGHYAEQLRDLFDHVGRDRVMVLETDRLFAAGNDDWARLLTHLGLPYWDPGAMPRDNARPSVALDAGLRLDLERYFAPFDRALVEVLGREPSWMR